MYLDNQKGYSLMETLVAVAIVASLATLVTQMNMFSSSGENTNYRRVCESIANSTIAVIQERGPIETIDSFRPLGAARNMTAYAPFAVPIRGVTGPGQLFAATPQFVIQSSPATRSDSPELNNYQQIRGSLRTLSAIYNNNAGLRCNWQTYNPVIPDLNLINLPVALSSITPTVNIQLVPFDTTTGAELSCAGNPALYFAPPAVGSGTVADAFFVGSGSQGVGTYDISGGPAPTAGFAIARRSTNVTSNRGIVMKSRVNFTIRDQIINCEASQRFQYEADRLAPTAPNISIVAGSNVSMALPTSMPDRCTPGVARDVTLQVGYAAAVEPGTQLFCRDLSGQRGYTQPASATQDVAGLAHSVPCVLSTAGIDTSPLPQNLVHSLDNANLPPNDFTLRGQNLAGANTEHWRPCDQVKICGVAPTAAAFGTAGYTLNYSLPQGCLINLEARGVDTAGNISAISTFAQSAAHMNASRQLTAAALSSEIYKPVCGWNTANTYFKPEFGTYCKPAPAAQDDAYSTYTLSVNETFNWTPNAGIPANNTPGSINFRARFQNGYYTCRGKPSFGATLGSTNGCCTGFGCTPFN